MNWKKGRGRLGVFEPLLGSWYVDADTDRGPVHVTRSFTRILGDKYIELRAEWEFGKSTYEELCLFGVDKDKTLKFWSFTSDGKNSRGQLADASDVHGDALGFEAQMDMGLARQVYWPDEQEGMHWAVESLTKKGWNRFVNHHYRKMK